MSTDTISPTNTQDYSHSDEDILDGFADPIQERPDGADTHDDGVPLGLGGEQGKQSEPASATLEADLLDIPGKPDDSAPSEPVQDAGDDGSDDVPDQSQESETPDFPPELLQLAGYSDADAALKDGFTNPTDLFAAVKLIGKRFTAPEKKDPVSLQGLYGRKEEPKTSAPETTPEQESDFTLPEDTLATLDDDVADLFRGMHSQFQKQLDETRSTVAQLREERASEQADDEFVRFDEVIQSLSDWKDVFGEGDGVALHDKGQYDPDMLARLNHRAMTFDAAQRIRRINIEQGGKPMPLEQEVRMALMQRYPDKYHNILSKSSSGRIPKGATASRPTQRKTPPKSANKALIDGVFADIKRKHGISMTRNTDVDELDGEF